MSTATITFLEIEDTIAIHDALIRRFSPTESAALRDAALLESAVLAPQQTWDGNYLHGSLAAMAAAYLVGLVQNHAFENGNKRVSFAACSVFLRTNGYRLTLSQEEVVDLTFGVIDHRYDSEAAARILQEDMEPL